MQAVASRETARVLPNATRETRTYNVYGDLETATDFNGRTTTWHYTVNGELERIDYPRDHDVTFGYDANGQRDAVTDGRGRSTTDHDRHGRIERTVDADGAVIEYTYDAAGNLESRTSVSQSLVYTYRRPPVFSSGAV